MYLTDLESVQIDPYLDQTSKRENSSAKERSNVLTKNYRHFLHDRINKRKTARTTIRYNAFGSALNDIISRMRIFTLTVERTNQRRKIVLQEENWGLVYLLRALRSSSGNDRWAYQWIERIDSLSHFFSISCWWITDVRSLTLSLFS